MSNHKTAQRLVFSLIAIMVVNLCSMESSGQEANYDEEQVPIYELPNPLQLEDGQIVQDSNQWNTQRRPQILRLFKQHVYGTMPPASLNPPSCVVTKQRDINIELTDGAKKTGVVRAKLTEMNLAFSDKQAVPQARLLILLPAQSAGPCPVFLAYNFQGNHSIHPTPEITLGQLWTRDRELGIPDVSSRGAQASRWPVGLILSRGYGLVTLHYGDVDPDFDDAFRNGVHPLYPHLQNRPDNWTSIGGWAWGLQRVLDYLETNPSIASDKVAILGHSRLGKTCLWAGATDQRFALVISNNSGCGGAAIARRQFGETVARINHVFPHWFCQRHKDYSENVNALPVDQHMLIALMAPRPVYIASAQEDRWADPKGEFLSAFHAQPVYRLFGKSGLAWEEQTGNMPALNKSIGNEIGYHIRSGKHDVTRFDWQQYLDFADRHLRE